MPALVAIIMGSQSDWETLEHAARTLDDLGVEHEIRVVSAHRTPDLLMSYAASAESRGLEVIIAGAGGAAHLPGMCAAKTVLPVLGVPVESKALHGVDSLLSIVQMPSGVPVGTLAIGRAGAVNAALLAASILGAKHGRIRENLRRFRLKQTENVLAHPDPRGPGAAAASAAPSLAPASTPHAAPTAQARPAPRPAKSDGPAALARPLAKTAARNNVDAARSRKPRRARP